MRLFVIVRLQLRLHYRFHRCRLQLRGAHRHIGHTNAITIAIITIAIAIVRRTTTDLCELIWFDGRVGGGVAHIIMVCICIIIDIGRIGMRVIEIVVGIRIYRRISS